MSFYDRFFVGRVVKDFGPIEDKFSGLGRTQKSLLLVERGGEFKLVFKFSTFFLGLFGVHYFDLSFHSVNRLRQCLDEAHKLAGGKSIGPHIDRADSDDFA